MPLRSPIDIPTRVLDVSFTYSSRLVVPLHGKTTYFIRDVFTGIIEALGRVAQLQEEGGNLHITLRSELASELAIDQSLSHNGVCLTVVALGDGTYTVTAVRETLQKSNLGSWQLGDAVNLERAMKMGDRLDGHIVQGHVDTTARVTKIEEEDGSWRYSFVFEPKKEHVLVEKGSVTVDGVSLTVVNAAEDGFDVAIIPYTYENTRFKEYHVGSTVNLEFDIIGKYVARIMPG